MLGGLDSQTKNWSPGSCPSTCSAPQPNLHKGGEHPLLISPVPHLEMERMHGDGKEGGGGDDNTGLALPCPGDSGMQWTAQEAVITHSNSRAGNRKWLFHIIISHNIDVKD